MQTIDWSHVAIYAPFFWIGGVIALSIVLRKMGGRPIFPRAPANARFKRSGISGASHRDLLTRLGGARNCLLVAVTGKSVMITPTFPFNLMFLPNVYDLEHDIPLSSLQSVNWRPALFGQIVEISFLTRRGFQRRIVLRLRNGEELVAALQKR